MKKLISFALMTTLLVPNFNFQVKADAKEIANNIEVYHSKINVGTNDKESYQKVKDIQFGYDLVSDKENVITVLPERKDQIMEGIGGAMTEASAYVIGTLPQDKQEDIYSRFFDADKAAFSMVRTNIGSCDFSSHTYDYAPDKARSIATKLDNFSIKEDEKDLIPALQKTLAHNPKAKIYSAPWAPPAWMKVSGDRMGDDLLNAGSITTKQNHLDPQYYSLYATYLIKYLQAYKAKGIPIYNLSLQNETQNNADWESCYWTIPQSVDFIQHHLGPRLEAAGFGDMELMIWDWDRQEGSLGKGDGFISYNRGVLNSGAGKYVDSIGFHWYGPINFMNNGQGGLQDYHNINTLHKEYPNIKLYGSEACQGLGGTEGPARRYIYDIVNDIRAGANGWMDWNLVLDSKGGPVKVPNNCFAPIMVDIPTQKVTVRPEYYALKHLSRTIRPGDRKIFSAVAKEPYQKENQLLNVAFLDKDTGKEKLIVANTTKGTKDFYIREGGRVAKVTLPGSTIATYIITPGAKANYNASLNGYAKASAYEDNPVNDYRPYKAFDGNIGTRWASDWNKDNQWIQVDLGLPMTVTGVDLIWEWGFKNEYAIQVSEDGVNWITAKVMDGNKTFTNTERNPYEVNIGFQPIYGRYVRMQGIKNKQGYGYSLYVMRVIASGANANYKLDDTSAINKPCKASDYEGNLINDYRPERAFDRDVNSRWASGWSDNQWIQVDLQQNKKIAGVLLNWEWGWKNIYEIQVSDDGVNWKTVTRIDGSPDGKGTTWNNPTGNREVIRINFEPVEGRYVKMKGIKNKQGYGYSLYDFKVYTLR